MLTTLVMFVCLYFTFSVSKIGMNLHKVRKNFLLKTTYVKENLCLQSPEKDCIMNPYR